MLEKLKKSHEELQRLKKNVSRSKYTGSALGQRFLATALAAAPGLSFTAAETIIPLIVASLFADSGLAVDFSLLAASLPSATVLKEILAQNAADYIILTTEKLKNAENVLKTTVGRQT